MKKFFALVLAVAMVLSMGSAFASIGWAQSTSSTANATASVSISVKALEYSGTSQDYTQYGLSDATVWKEITGRVVKDTLVKFPVTITVPSATAAGLSSFDYVNPAIKVVLTNATMFQVVDSNGSNITSAFNSSDSGHTLVANWTVSDSGSSYAFTVLAIVDSSATVNCNVSFTMGQTISSTTGGTVYFVSGGDTYEATWTPGSTFVVENLTSNAIVTFALGSNNLFTTGIYFNDPYVINGSVAMPGNVPVTYCLNGELAFNGYCSCNKDQWPSNLIATAWYEQIKADFNEIMNAIGFSFSYGNFAAAYCTAAGILSLTKQISVSSAVTLTASTELGVSATTPTVTIPQTGAVSVIGYALVTLAGAALAVSRKK